METAAPACQRLELPCIIEEWTREVADERLTPFPDGVLKSITDVQNTYYRENSALYLPFERSYECPGINQSGMKTAVA